MRTAYLYFSILFIVVMIACDDDAEDQNKDKALIDGTVTESSTGERVEGVAIIGFDGGVYTNNFGTHYGSPVQLGVTNECGEFQIELPENIRGVGAHGLYDTTVALLRFTREDVGETTSSVSYSTKTLDVSMIYDPILKPFFKELYAVRSADLQSVTIGWNIYSLREIYTCPPPIGGPCINDSDGFVHIGRSNISPYQIPIQLNTDQTMVDSDLPDGDFSYWITPGDSKITSYSANMTSSMDTLFLVKRYTTPVYNHCD